MGQIETKDVRGRAVKGHTLAELMFVVLIAGILFTLAFPAVGRWRADLEYRRATRDMVCILRDARSRSISANLEHRVECEPALRRYRLTQGNLAKGSNQWDTIVYDWIVLPPGVVLGSTATSIQMNTNGTSGTGTITIQNESLQSVYEVKVSNAGRIRTVKILP